MLVVKLEIWPHGNEASAREVGRLLIANDGTGTEAVGNYTAVMEDASCRLVGSVANFERKRTVWRLVYRALWSCLSGVPSKNAVLLKVHQTRPRRATPRP